MTDFGRLLFAPAVTLRAATTRINETGAGIVLIVDEDQHLLFTLTDGDIRRAILDKDVRVAPGAEIGFDLGKDRKRFHVSEGGIVVIPKGTVVE